MYFEQFCEERNIKPETIKRYKSSIKQYSDYYQMTFDELINEAIDEEAKGVDKRRRSLKNRLLQFRSHLLSETNLRTSTIQTYLTNICSAYAHFDIEIPYLTPIKNNDSVQTTYFDLPTREQIRMAVELAGIRVGSLMLFMASSGTGRTECANMCIQDFTDACKGYYESTTLPDIIQELSESIEDIVPTFYLFRQKTSKRYYTFCTPECTNAIIEWLELKLMLCEEEGVELKFEDSLWDLTPRQISYHLQSINDELDFGYKGASRFLRPHTLRKFHASNIGLSEDNIDLLQGRSRDSVHETYIKTNPEKFKQTYMNVMDNVTIGKIGDKNIIHEDFTININLNFYGAEYGVSL